MPHFSGASYLQYQLPDDQTMRHSTQITMDINPDTNNGMILWVGVDPTAGIVWFCIRCWTYHKAMHNGS